MVKRLSTSKVEPLQSITVALDAMGGDFGPRVTVPAAVQALSHFPELKVILIGDQPLITSQLSQLGTSTSSRLSILHSEKVISNSEKPSLALRNSQNSSMRMAIDLVSENGADACVSGGNTGALWRSHDLFLNCFLVLSVLL